MSSDLVLMNGGEHAMLGQCSGHFKGADGIHVGRNDGNTTPFASGMHKVESAVQIDLGSALQGGSLGANQDILEAELDIVFYTHEQFCAFTLGWCRRWQPSVFPAYSAL